MPVEGDTNWRVRRARQFDRSDGVDAKAGLRAESAADMVGDHAHLVVAELVSFRNELHHVEHRLGRDVQGQAFAIEARHGGVRLKASVRLTRGPEDTLDKQRITRLGRRGDGAAYRLGLV